jgi:hypothetical protein
MVGQGQYADGTEFTITVTYNWFGSPRRDFTLKSYSIDGNDITDEDGDTNMLHADGSNPSEFDYIEDEWSEGRAEDDSSGSFNRFMEGYTGCLDTAFDATDSYGDGCDWYVVDTYCGYFDDSDFETGDMCCSCGGGCYDSADGEVDDNGYGCEYYTALPHLCGEYDTSDFEAEDMCCACQTFEAWEASTISYYYYADTYYYEDEYYYYSDYEYSEEYFEEEYMYEPYEIDEDFNFEVTDFAEIEMALDFYADAWTRYDLDGEYQSEATAVQLDNYPESFVGVMFSTADMNPDDNDISLEVTLTDDSGIMYEGYYFADALEDWDAGYHWVRFFYIPDMFEANRYGAEAEIVFTIDVDGDATEFTYTVTLREPSDDEEYDGGEEYYNMYDWDYYVDYDYYD